MPQQSQIGVFSQDQRQLLHYYINMYNRNNYHIDRLLIMQREVHTSINHIVNSTIF